MPDAFNLAETAALLCVELFVRKTTLALFRNHHYHIRTTLYKLAFAPVRRGFSLSPYSSSTFIYPDVRGLNMSPMPEEIA